MHIARLHIHQVRNLAHLQLSPHPQLNWLCGPNGSGKTSVLEAIYLLAQGRSFRTRHLQTVIRHQQAQLTCFAEIQDPPQRTLSLGIEKAHAGRVRCHIGGEPCEKRSLLAAVLPLQLLTPDTFQLLLAGPEARRRYVDWGVFHVEPSFAALCQRYQRLMQQRNALLKSGRVGETFWDQAFSAVGEQITHYRQAYVSALQPYLAHAQQTLLPQHPLTLTYLPGWSAAHTLGEALARSAAQDERFGMTRVGPHRAEMDIRVAGVRASHVLSRGQQKLLICALMVAQAQHWRAQLAKPCVYLLDDWASELDKDNRQRLLAHFAAENHQVFMTGVESEGGEAVARGGGKMFHVEQGRVWEATVD